jgi:probable phosphoglycerate mutase
METYLYFLRHAQSAANALGVVQGIGLDIPLTDLGRVQAKEAAQALAGFSFDKIFSSKAKRALHTAAEIKQIHSAVSHEEIHELHERGKGGTEGMLKKDFLVRYPKIEEAWKREEDARPPLGGENFEDVRNRVMPILERHLESHAGKKLLYVTHGNLIRVVLGEFLNVPFGLRGRIAQDYCGLSLVTYNHDRKRFKVEFMNRKLCS